MGQAHFSGTNLLNQEHVSSNALNVVWETVSSQRSAIEER